MIQNKLDDIIQSFCGDDELRETMMNPHFEPDTKQIIATNKHVLIVAPDKYFDGKYETNKAFPNWQAVMPKQSELPLFKLKTHDILAEVALIPLVDIFDTCRFCQGGGTHQCTCGDMHDCAPCQGTGEDSYKVIGKELPHTTRFKIKGIAYSCKYINQIAEVAERLCIDEIPIYAQYERKPFLVMLDEIKIMIMPLPGIQGLCYNYGKNS